MIKIKNMFDNRKKASERVAGRGSPMD